MSQPDIGAMRAVAERLDQLGLKYAFVGGAIVQLLVDEPELSLARPTDDVDVIVEILTTERLSELEARLRTLGFAHDTREDAPLCRWILENLTVDIMPTEGAKIGLKHLMVRGGARNSHRIGSRAYSPSADFPGCLYRHQIRGLSRPR